MKRVAAFILAGGVGKRLSLLTSHRAKPAVPFAGRYRIIDFTLTNCVNSDITDVYILTQYISRSLVGHLGIGKPWDMDRMKGGLTILHPRLGYEGADWYMGTADAIFQNLPVLAKLDRKYILILSGDHVYNMDYSHFLEEHIRRGTPASLGVIEIPQGLCREFGIATIDRNGEITKFEEKPLSSRSNLASMGIYFFEREFLMSLLNELKPGFSNLDFGKHVIPTLVERKQISAYLYDGYWLDIGTLRSYYKAHMDLLSARPRLKLYEGDRSVMTLPDDDPPTVVSKTAFIERALVCNGCRIEGKVINSILSPGVRVDEGAIVENSIIMHGCRISRNAKVHNSIVDKMSVIGRDASVGKGDPSVKNAVQPEYLDFGATLIGNHTKIPGKVRIGTNCLVCGSRKKDGRVPKRDIGDGGSYIAEGVRI